MLERLKKWAIAGSSVLDVVFLLLSIPSALALLAVRRFGLQRLPLTKSMLMRIGVLPIRRHYYEPLIHPDDLLRPLDEVRTLHIDWNDDQQLNLLRSFRYHDELLKIPRKKISPFEFCYENNSFSPGDAEYYYSFIRHNKPKKIIEVGSGNSTLLARIAIQKNREENPDYRCEYVCIEPYEFKWLESLTDLTVIRKRVEEVEMELFSSLGQGDLLFIDSTHMIRPHGDVVFEILELLPKLSPGVFVHFHDIFSPRNYPQNWVFERYFLWNEQYMLEAFLTSAKNFKIIGALNYLMHKYPNEMDAALPIFATEKATRNPASFYIQKLM